MAEVAAPTDKVTASLSPSAIANGAGPAVGAPKPPHVTSVPAAGAPKPVQCTSVPDTPIKGTTPANGSPAPELPIDPETGSAGGGDPGPASQHDKNAILGPQDPTNTKRRAPEPEVDIAGPDSPELPKRPSEAPAPGTSEETGAEAVPNDDDETNDAPPGKKAKLSDKAASVVDNIKDKVIGKSDSSSSRSTKDKSRTGPGKTERKTRSQGPIEEDRVYL